MKNHRQKYTDDNVKDDVDQGPNHRLEENRPEQLLPENGDELRQPDQAPVPDVVNVRVRKRENEIERKRESNDCENDEQRRPE